MAAACIETTRLDAHCRQGMVFVDTATMHWSLFHRDYQSEMEHTRISTRCRKSWVPGGLLWSGQRPLCRLRTPTAGESDPARSNLSFHRHRDEAALAMSVAAARLTSRSRS
jgi:hypothetical protein